MSKISKRLLSVLIILTYLLIAACNSQPATTAVKTEKPEETVTVNGKTYKAIDVYNMKKEQLKEFMGQALDEELPPNYPVPDYITNATSTKEMYNTFYERYPHFAFQQADALIAEVSFRPQMYVDMIRENKVLRQKVEQLDKTTNPK